jgi:hypothetical protein
MNTPFRFISNNAIVRALVFSIAIVAGLNSSRAHAQVIDTASEWLASGPNTFEGPFGEPAFAAWGQTFVTPAGFNTLTSFSVWLQTNNESDNETDAVDFTGKVYQWDTGNLTLTGPALFSSPPQHLPFEDPPSGFKEFSFTPKLALDPEKTYIFFLSAHDFFNGKPGTASVGGGFNHDTYSGGDEFISESSFADLSTSPWIPNGVGADMAFVARFSSLSPVPEPATYGVAASLILLGLARRRHLKTHD